MTGGDILALVVLKKLFGGAEPARGSVQVPPAPTPQPQQPFPAGPALPPPVPPFPPPPAPVQPAAPVPAPPVPTGVVVPPQPLSPTAPQPGMLKAVEVWQVRPEVAAQAGTTTLVGAAVALADVEKTFPRGWQPAQRVTPAEVTAAQGLLRQWRRGGVIFAGPQTLTGRRAFRMTEHPRGAGAPTPVVPAPVSPAAPPAGPTQPASVFTPAAPQPAAPAAPSVVSRRVVSDITETRFSDGTRHVTSPTVEFFADGSGNVTRVVRGTPADVAAAIDVLHRGPPPFVPGIPSGPMPGVPIPPPPPPAPVTPSAELPQRPTGLREITTVRPGEGLANIARRLGRPPELDAQSIRELQAENIPAGPDNVVWSKVPNAQGGIKKQGRRAGTNPGDRFFVPLSWGPHDPAIL